MMRAYFFKTYFALSSSVTAGYTAQRVWQAKSREHESTEWFNPKFNEKLVASIIGVVAGGIAGPFIVPTLPLWYMKESMYPYI